VSHSDVLGHRHVLTDVQTLDTVIAAHADELGEDLVGYRNHSYRVLNLCLTLGPAEAHLERVAIAAAYHDLGIWTHRTFDYLEPSAGLAAAHLQAESKAAWIPEVTEMIRHHHKLSRYRRAAHALVEPFRQADWIDVSRGLLTFGVSKTRVGELFAIWPSAGFHRRLVELEMRRLRTHPWSPLPMFRL
jgi:hypothetical protein